MNKGHDPTFFAKTDAISFLISDHAAIEDLFSQFNALVDASAPAHEKKRTIALKICAALTVHAQIEEEIFYPEVRASLVLNVSSMMDEADIDHAACHELISHIELMEPSDAQYEASVVALGEFVDHHVKAEEGQMFRSVRKLRLDSANLGHELAIRRQELLNDYTPHKRSFSGAVLA